MSVQCHVEYVCMVRHMDSVLFDPDKNVLRRVTDEVATVDIVHVYLDDL